MVKTRIYVECPRLVKLLKAEAHESGFSVKQILVTALEVYLFPRWETKALNWAAEDVLTEWNDARDSDYDSL